MLSVNLNPRNSYFQLFDKAQDNWALVCKEYQDSLLCKRTRRRVKSTIKLK